MSARALSGEVCPPGASHCITCADEAVPMRVVGTGEEPGRDAGPAGLAICEDERGRRAEVLTGLLASVRVGDRLLVHAGAALLRLDREDRR